MTAFWTRASHIGGIILTGLGTTAVVFSALADTATGVAPFLGPHGMAAGAIMTAVAALLTRLDKAMAKPAPKP